jgi:hypothetical protein
MHIAMSGLPVQPLVDEFGEGIIRLGQEHQVPAKFRFDRAHQFASATPCRIAAFIRGDQIDLPGVRDR